MATQPVQENTHAQLTSGELLHEAARRHFMWQSVPKAEVQPLILASGSGVTVINVDGDAFIDLTSSGSRASTLGYGQEDIVEAMSSQLQRLHLSGLRGRVCDTTVRLAERLAGVSPHPDGACWFVSSGSEAVEDSVKIAKAYHRAVGDKPHAFKVISRWGAYHGVVGSALASTAMLPARSPYEPGVPGVSRIPAPWAYRWPFGVDYETWSRLCVEYLEQHILEEDPSLVAAFIAEPVMQYNGAQPPPGDYFARVREICTKYDVLFIADEVITGFGRTGEWFGLNSWQVKPDLICTAKGITAGYAPLAAVIASRRVWDAIPALYGGHTHAGSPAAAAASLAVCDVYERDGIIERSKSVGAETLARLRSLEELDAVGQVRGQGMWFAIDFTSDKSVQALPDPRLVTDVSQRAQELGVIVSPIGTSVELAPSLNIGAEDLDAGLSRFEAAVREVTAKHHKPQS